MRITRAVVVTRNATRSIFERERYSREKALAARLISRRVLEQNVGEMHGDSCRMNYAVSRRRRFLPAISRFPIISMSANDRGC